MRKAFAIMMLTIRAAIRSRLFVCLLVVSLMIVVLLPLTVKSDGTPEGLAKVALQYVLGTVTTLLSIMTVWWGCRAAGGEIETREVHLVVTKPVHRIQLWIGKWLAIVALNTILLGIVGVCTYATLHLALRRSGFDEDDRLILREEILVARTAVDPVETWPEPRAGATMREANTVLPGKGRRWVFRLDRRPPGGRDLFVMFHLTSPQQLLLKRVAVAWATGMPDDETRHTHSDRVYAGSPRTFKIPASAVSDDNTLTLEYFNVQKDPPSAVLFQGKYGVRVLVPRSSFSSNMLRALLMSLFKLAALAGLGISLGGAISTPVAIFTAYAVLAMMSFGDFVSTMAGAKDILPTMQAPGFVRSLIRLEFRVLDFLSAPVTRLQVLSLLPRGEYISWASVGQAFVVFIVVYCGFLALLGTWLSRKRELGLPAR
jgi:hypothetical protein